MMDTIFSVILRMSITASVAIFFILFTRYLFKDRLPRIFYYAIWAIVLIRLLLPLSLSSQFSIYNILAADNPKIDKSIIYTTNNNYNNTTIHQIPRLEKQRNSTDNNVHVPVPETSANSVMFYISYVWIAGAIGLLVFSMYSYKRTLKILDTSIIYNDNGLVEECSKILKLKRKVRVLSSDRIDTPVVCGLFIVRIIIPTALYNSSNEKDLRHIITHELVHIKRFDNIIKLLSVIAVCIHWFNPLVWFSFVLSQKDMEMSCDEKVLSVYNEDIRSEYAKALINIAARQNVILNGGLLAFGESNIKTRIKGIMKYKKTGIFLSIIAVVMIVVFSVLLLTNSNVNEEDKNASAVENNNNIEQLLQHRTKYIGDASNVGNLINKLTFSEFKTGISLLTDKQPYGLIINYNFNNTSDIIINVESTLQKNALIILSLIENVDSITVKLNGLDKIHEYKYLRKDLEKNLDNSLYEYSKDIETFEKFIDNLSLDQSLKNNSNEIKDIDESISAAIKEQGKVYLNGECITEGHIVFDKEVDDEEIKVYTISSVGWFGFENNIFTKVSGSGAIPTVMKFSKNEKGEYILEDYIEPLDGAGYNESIKKMFPQKLHEIVLTRNDSYYSMLKQQQEQQAAQYLENIDRKAKVSADYVEKQLVNINIEASNKLFSEFTKYNTFLNSCPYWIGTKEKVEEGIRYIYETSQSKSDDGYDVVIFKKKKDDGTVVEQYKYKIIGNEPQLIKEASLRKKLWTKDNWTYYLEVMPKGKAGRLLRINEDGTPQVIDELVNVMSSNNPIIHAEDRIVFIGYKGTDIMDFKTNTIISIKEDGSDRKTYNTKYNTQRQLCYDSGYLYYEGWTNASEFPRPLCRLNIDLSNNMKMADLDGAFITVQNGYAYYLNKKIHRLKLDWQSNSQIWDDNINLGNNVIFVQKINDYDYEVYHEEDSKPYLLKTKPIKTSKNITVERIIKNYIPKPFNPVIHKDRLEYKGRWKGNVIPTLIYEMKRGGIGTVKINI